MIARVDAWQRRHALAAFSFAVVRKFLDDRASSLAALIAYYAFLSIFPLLLVFVSVLGFVLQDNASLQDDVVDSALARIPVLGAQLSSDVQPLAGSTAALIVGLVGALWAGLGVTLALGRAFDQIWAVPRCEQRGTLAARFRGVVALTVLGVALIASTVVTGLALGGKVSPALEAAAALIAALGLNGLVCLAVFGLLTGRRFRVRELLPGVVLAAAGALVLQSVGTWYVEHTVANASETYGTFALVIGLLSWFWLGSHLLLLAAEVNVVRHGRLWPRSIDGELRPADRATLRRSAMASRQDRRQEIVVSFHDPAP